MLYCLSSSRHIVPVVAVTQSSVGEWLSLVEHLVRDQGVGGSNPLSPTNLSLLSTLFLQPLRGPQRRSEWDPITFDTSTSQRCAYKVFFHASSRHLDGYSGTICRSICSFGHAEHGSSAGPRGTQGSQQNRSLLSRNGEAHAPWWRGQVGSCSAAKWDG